MLKSPYFTDDINAKKLAQTFLLVNSTNSTQALDYLRNNRNATLQKAIEISKQGEKHTDIICYSIMPNHYHLLLKEIRDNGITNFIHKCNTSVAKYINIKNGRTGPLFESKFKSKRINSNEYLLCLSVYIHLNPLDFLVGKEWRFNRLKNWTLAKEKLLNYPWSSFKFFLDEGINNQALSGTEIILDQFNNRKEYEQFLKEWSLESLEKINDLLLE